MGRIIAIANQKGGVGKTTTAVNLAAALGLSRKNTLLVDMDPQGNATSGFGIQKKDLPASSYDLLIASAPAGEAVLPTQCRRVSIIPAVLDLAAAELELVNLDKRESRLKNALVQIRDSYDYILLDCPPALGLLTVLALTACDTVLIPMQCEFFALEGLSQLMSTVRQVKRRYNPSLDMEGILLTMYDRRLNLTAQVREEVEKFYPGRIFDTVIPRGVRLSEAPSYGQPIQYYDKHSKGAKAYNDLAKEIIKHSKRK